MNRKHWLILGAMLLSAVSLSAQAGGQCRGLGCVTVEELQSLDPSTRVEIFAQLPTDRQVALVRDHIIGWRTARVASLYPSQTEFIDELLGALTADWYRGDRGTKEDVQLQDDLLRRGRALFTPVEVAELLFLQKAPR